MEMLIVNASLLPVRVVADQKAWREREQAASGKLKVSELAITRGRKLK